MRILGIDPGLATVGLGSIEAQPGMVFQNPDWLTIETKAGLSIPERLKELQEDLRTYMSEIQPELAVIEKIFFAVNQKTVIDVAQARGALIATVAEFNIPIIEPTPMELKLSITGDGNADKKQVQDMLVRTLNLTETPQPDDAADALGLALYGAFTTQRTAIA